MRRPSFLMIYVLPVSLLLFPACHRETEEDMVRKVVIGVGRAAEDKKILSVLEHVSKNYHDSQGNDHDGIKGLLAYYFFRHQKVGVLIPAMDIAVDGPSARAVFQAILTGRGSGETASAVLPEALGAYDFEVLLKKEEGAWKVTSARWERVGEAAEH